MDPVHIYADDERDATNATQKHGLRGESRLARQDFLV